MPKQITQYRVFIGSPGGLDAERACFRSKLEKYTALHAEHRGILFHPVGWEDTVGGAGRPQALINEDLKQCDYAVFVLHDRWGSPTGSDYTSGTEEEWAIAEELYQANKIRNIALFFKRINPNKLSDPGKQLEAVLAFKKRIEEGKRYLFRQYEASDQFAEFLEEYLARWLRDLEAALNDLPASGLVTGGLTTAGSAAKRAPIASPGFDYWMAEATRLTDATVPDHAGALFCSSKATDAAKSDIDWARARNLEGITQFRLGKPDEAIAAFQAIAEKLSTSDDASRREWRSGALLNIGITLSSLGRSEEAIAVYDDLLTRFGTSTELPLREQVAKALFNKGVAFGSLGRSDEAIAVYDDLLARFGTSTELPLREQVARALFNKGVTLGSLGRSEEAIAVYDDLLDRFGTSTELPMRERVARALFNKGVRLGSLGRSEEAVTVYDDLLARFGTSTELPLREQLARALVNKGVRLGSLGRGEEEVMVYDDLLARFGTSTESFLQEQVAKALLYKGSTLESLGRSDEAIAVCDDLLARFGTSTESHLQEQVMQAKALRSSLRKS